MLHQRQLAAPGKALNFVEFIRQIHAVHVSHIYSRGVASMLRRPSSIIVYKGFRGTDHARLPLFHNHQHAGLL